MSEWDLACQVCRKGWPEDTEMGVIAEHWNTEHEGQPFYVDGRKLVAEHDAPHLELVWSGPNPAPRRDLRT